MISCYRGLIEEYIPNFSNLGHKNAYQLSGCGRPLKCKQFDDYLADWVRSQRKKNLRVSRQMILNEAQRTAKFYFYDEDNEETSFKVML